MEVGPLSASTLGYLFGDELAGAVSHHRLHQAQYGVEVPTTGAVVLSEALDGQMLTLAVWEACEVGALEVDLVEATGVRGKVGGRVVALSPTGQPGALPGLAGRLVRRVREGDAILAALDRCWPSQPAYVPLDALIDVAQGEAIEVGALVPATSVAPVSHALRWSAGSPRYDVVEGGLGLLEQLWDDVEQRWLAAREAEPQLWRTVGADARHAVRDGRPERQVWASPVPMPPPPG